MTAATDATLPRARPLYGIALVVLATLALAMADVVTKQQAMRHPLSVVVALRYLVNLALLALFFAPRHGADLWRTNRRGLVFLRSLSLAFASLTLGLALQRMPLGETIAIVYLAPFAVMLLAVPLLGERVGWAGWVGAVVGFSGVLLIVRPGGGLDTLGVVITVVNAGIATVYHLLTRHLARTENTIAMTFQTALVGSVIFGVLALGALGDLSIDAADLGQMALLGVFSTVGHFLFTAAYREAPASFLAPVNYLHMFWAGGLGWLIFHHVPDGPSLAGMALIFLSGVAVALRAHRAK